MVRLQALKGEFDLLRMKETETVEEYFNRVVTISNQLKINGEEPKDQRIVEKILRTMTKNFEHVVVAIEESKNLSELSLESLLGSLQSHELRIKQFASSSSEQAFQMQETSREGYRGRGRRTYTHGRGRGRGQIENVHANAKEENKGHYDYGRGRGQGRQSERGRGNTNSQFQCHYCHKYGHLKKDCYKRLREEKHESKFLHENSENVAEESVLLACNVQENPLDKIWYIDSGCSNHMTGNRGSFITFDDSFQQQVKTGEDRRLSVEGRGDILIQSKQGSKRVSDVYYVPGLKHNLLSVGQLLQKGHHVLFKQGECEIRDKNSVLIARVNMTENKMFPLRLHDQSLSCFATIVNDKSWLWHHRYNHLSFSTLTKICKEHMVRGIPNIKKQDQVCESCVFGKHHRNPFPSGIARRADQPLGLVHTDLCGPMRVTSLGRNRYFLTFIDDYSRKLWIYFLKEK